MVDDILAGNGRVTGETHPEHYVRGYAEWLFSESDVYASITGQGSGKQSLHEIDVMLTDLLLRRTGVVPGQKPKATKRALVSDTVTIGDRDDERELRRKAVPASLEDLAVDILTDGTRRKLNDAGKAIADLARNAPPSFQRLANVARARLHASGYAKPAESPRSDTADPGDDPLDEERRALEARFEELERNTPGK